MTPVQPIRQLITQFITAHSEEVIRPEKTGADRVRGKRAVNAARDAVHVFALLLEQKQVPVVQIAADILEREWLPLAATYKRSGEPGSVNAIELNKRANAINAFIRWLIATMNFPLEHVKLLPLTFDYVAKKKETTMQNETATQSGAPVPLNDSPATPQFVVAPSTPPPMPPPVQSYPASQPVYAVPPPQPITYVAQPPPPPYMTQPAQPQVPQAAQAQQPRPRPAAQPTMPSTKPARSERVRELLAAHFPEQTEKVRVWVHKPDPHGTGTTPVFVGDSDIEQMLTEQGVEPFLLKHYVMRVLHQLGPNDMDVTFDIVALSTTGTPLSQRGSYTVIIPPNMRGMGARPAPGTPNEPKPPEDAGFVIDGKRYVMVGGKPRLVEVLPAAAPVMTQPPAAAQLDERVLGRIVDQLDRLDQRLDQLESRGRHGGGSMGLGSLGDFGMPQPSAPVPTPVPAQPSFDPMAMMEANERLIDKVLTRVGPNSDSAQASPMGMMKELLGMMTGIMQITQPRQINVDTQGLEDRIKLLDAKMEAKLGKGDQLQQVVQTVNTMRSLFGLEGNPFGGAAKAAPKTFAEIVGEILTTAITKMPETVEAFDRAVTTVGRVRQSQAAEQLRQRATQPPVGTTPPRAPSTPALASAPTPKRKPTLAPPATPAPPKPEAPKTPKYVITPSDIAYRTPGVGNALPEDMHTKIVAVLNEANRDARLANLIDLNVILSSTPDLVQIARNLETLLTQSRFGRVVELMTVVMNKFGYENVTQAYMLGLIQDLVRFGVEQNQIREIDAAEFLGITAEQQVADSRERVIELERERAVRRRRGQIVEDAPAQPAEAASASADDEADEAEGEEDADADADADVEDEDGEDVPALGGELTIAVGDGNPDDVEEPVMDEPEQDAPEQDAPEADPEEGHEPEPELPAPSDTNAAAAAEAEESAKPAKKKRKKAKKAQETVTTTADDASDADDAPASE